MAKKLRTGQFEPLKFAGPRATSQAVVLPVLFVVSLNASPLGLSLASVALPDFLALLALSGALSWAYFTLAGQLIRR